MTSEVIAAGLWFAEKFEESVKIFTGLLLIFLYKIKFKNWYGFWNKKVPDCNTPFCILHAALKGWWKIWAEILIKYTYIRHANLDWVKDWRNISDSRAGRVNNLGINLGLIQRHVMPMWH